MHTLRHRRLAVCIVLLFTLTSCASDPSGSAPDAQAAETNHTQEAAPEQSPDTDGAADVGEISIPAGAYAASAEFPFPVPNGWTILDEFTEGTVGGDVTMDGSIEYPGDAKDAAATYLSLLTAAGFDAYTYAPGEATNQASLAAEGVINGILYLAILNFDVHADGYQRVSVTAAERD